MTNGDTRTDAEGIGIQWLALTLFRRRWLWLGTAFVLASLVVLLGFTRERTYSARAVLIAADSSSGGLDLNAMLGQFSGLASLAGFAAGKNSDTEEAIGVLRSRAFTESFIVEHDLMPQLYYNVWDATNKQWKVDEGARPSLAMAYKKFDSQIRTIVQDRRTGLVTVQIEWRDGKVAAQWVNLMIAKLNREMRARAIAESTRTIDYLTAELAKTNVVSVEQAINKVIEASIKQRSIAAVREEYAFKIVDPAAASDPRRPDRPRRLYYVLAAPIVGFLFATMLVLGLELFGQLRRWIRVETSKS